MANIPQLRAVLRIQPLAWIQPLAVVYWLYTTNPRGALLTYKLVTNVIREVKINVLSYPWYDIPRLSSNQHSGLEPSSL